MSIAPVQSQRQHRLLGTVANQIELSKLEEHHLLGLLARTRPDRREEVIMVAHARYNGQGIAVLEIQEREFDESSYEGRWRYCHEMRKADPSIDLIRTMTDLEADDLAGFAADSLCGVRNEAFEAFLKRIRPFVFNVMSNEVHVRGDEAKNEISRRVDFRLYSSFWNGRYQTSNSAFGFVRETIRQESLNYFKEERRRQVIGVVHVEPSSLEIIGRTEFDPVSRQNVNSEAVYAVLATMEEKHRVLVLMIDIEGYSVNEVAIRVGWSEDTVRRRHAAAHELFRQRWLSRFGPER